MKRQSTTSLVVSCVTDWITNITTGIILNTSDIVLLRKVVKEKNRSKKVLIDQNNMTNININGTKTNISVRSAGLINTKKTTTNRVAMNNKSKLVCGFVTPLIVLPKKAGRQIRSIFMTYLALAVLCL